MKYRIVELARPYERGPVPMGGYTLRNTYPFRIDKRFLFFWVNNGYTVTKEVAERWIQNERELNTKRDKIVYKD